MKTFLILLTTLFSTMVLAAPNQLPNNTTILGQKSSSGTKQIIFNNNQGASNTTISSDPIANDLTVSGSAIYLKAIDTKVGTGATSSSPSVKFDTGGVSDAVIRYNDSTSKLEFSNDGSVYKGIGSGSGSGGGGINFLANPDFEGNVTTGWTASGVTVTQQTYANGTADNAKFARIVATTAGQYWESDAYTIPTFLQNSDWEIGGISSGTVGAFRIESFLNGSSVVSQTLASATSFVKDPTIIFPVTSGTVKYRITALSAGTLDVDDKYLGPVKNLKNGAVVTGSQKYIATITGSSVTTQELFWYQRGDKIVLSGQILLNVPSAAPLTISLPNNYQVDGSKISTTGRSHMFGVARVLRASEANSLTTGPGVVDLVVINNGTLNVVQFAQNIPSAVGPIFANNNATDFANTGARIVLEEIAIPVIGLNGSSTTYDSRCPSDISCTNEFSAKSATGGTISNENLDWISGNFTNPSAGSYGGTFQGIFSVAPNCTATTNGSAGYIATVSNVTTTGVSVTTWLDNGVQTSIPFTINCQRSGSDFVAKGVMEMFASKMTSHSGDGLKRETWGTFGGAGSIGSPAVCSSSPCTKYGGDSAITSVTRNSTGLYTVFVSSGVFSSIESIELSTFGTNNAVHCQWNGVTATTVGVSCSNTNTGAATDWGFGITIKGAKP